MGQNTENPQRPKGHLRRPWLLAFVLMTTVFAFGVLVGLVISSGFLWHRTFSAFRHPGFVVDRMVRDLQYELVLSDEQIRQLEEMVAAHHETLKGFHDELQPKVEKELEAFHAKVEAMLRPEQAERWNARFRDMQDRWLPGRPDSFLPPPGGPIMGLPGGPMPPPGGPIMGLPGGPMPPPGGPPWGPGSRTPSDGPEAGRDRPPSWGDREGPRPPRPGPGGPHRIQPGGPQPPRPPQPPREQPSPWQQPPEQAPSKDTPPPPGPGGPPPAGAIDTATTEGGRAQEPLPGRE